MENRANLLDIVKLILAAARLLAGDVYSAASVIYKQRKLIAGILIGVLLFITIIGAIIISFPILIIQVIVPECLQGVVGFAIEALGKLASFVGDVIEAIISAVNSIVEFFFGEQGSGHKRSDVQGQADIDVIPVLIIYNVKYGNGYFDSSDIDENKFKQIAELFSNYSQGRSTGEIEIVETVTVTRAAISGPGIITEQVNVTTTVTEETLHVTISNLAFEDVLNSEVLGLDGTQKAIALNMFKMYQLNPGLFNGDPTGTYEELPQEEINKRLESAPTVSRANIINAASSIIDNVPFFWGGKSSVIGRDPEWASWTSMGWDSTKLKTVTSPGSPSSGFKRPYGLDCSGFIAWAYNNAGFGLLLQGGTSYQWGQSYAITESELQLGDLAFENPGTNSNNHVGIFAGHDAKGNNLYIHSAPYVSKITNHNGVTKDSYSRFRFFRRVIVNFQ